MVYAHPMKLHQPGLGEVLGPFDALELRAGARSVLLAPVGHARKPFFQAFGRAVANGAHAGNRGREVAKIAGGGGGGRADFASAGGKDPSKVADALAQAPRLLGEMLGTSTD